MQTQRQQINYLQAEYCAAIGDPSRIQIVYELANGPQNVKSLADTIGLSHSATSRHLKILRDKDLVSSDRQGHTVVYTLSQPELLTALDIFLKILNKQIKHRASLIEMERKDEE